jgi:adenylate kinase
MNLILLGRPGAGKGTQADWLRAELGLSPVATGDLLRKHRVDDTALGREASRYMSAGQLVPDELVIEMIREVIATEPDRGFLFDGFPRTIAQANCLAEALGTHRLELTAVLLIDTPDDVITARISGRRQCPNGHLPHEDGAPCRVLRALWCAAPR